MGQPYTANTTCDIYRYNHSPPATPDVSAVQIQLRPDFLSSHLAAIGSGSTMRWTHIALMPFGTDVRDGYSPGASAGLEATPANQDSCWVPDKNGVQFWTLFVERVGYNTGQDFLRVYLQRKSASGPNGNG